MEMEVRDYELDLQGIVNNSVYLNYFEHARHRCIKDLGLDFQDLHDQGVDPVVVRVELDYLDSLRSGQVFQVRTRIEAHGRLRFRFHQELVRQPSGTPCARAMVTTATLVKGRPAPWPGVMEAWEAWSSLPEQT